MSLVSARDVTVKMWTDPSDGNQLANQTSPPQLCYADDRLVDLTLSNTTGAAVFVQVDWIIFLSNSCQCVRQFNRKSLPPPTHFRPHLSLRYDSEDSCDIAQTAVNVYTNSTGNHFLYPLTSVHISPLGMIQKIPAILLKQLSMCTPTQPETTSSTHSLPSTSLP
ncbi:hypothetical protein J6590_006507 [Homalodisca vitripennis]|nr:hypothetical protein J6590_006507 [Homalodisca vitripennis]